MTRLTKLFVLGREPGHRRDVVGTLERHGSGFAFSYTDSVSDSFEIIGFPRRKGPTFTSPYLFATFSKRVPDPSRTDFGAMMQEWGVERTDDPLAILAKSGGFQVGDRLELAEYRDAEHDQLRQPLECRVAGPRHHDDPDCDTAKVGDPVLFERETTNKEDPNAVKVRVSRPNHLTLGYVPRQYAPIFARILDGGGSIVGKVRRQVLVPREGQRWVIEAHQAANERSAVAP